MRQEHQRGYKKNSNHEFKPQKKKIMQIFIKGTKRVEKEIGEREELE